jgi:AcrR family transcriptional regulator
LTPRRPYVSPKREAQAAATRQAIVEAFVEQLSEPGRSSLSPTAAARTAGVSVRTVHAHFPTADDQMVAVGEWLEHTFFPNGVRLAEGPDDLPRYYREVHTHALRSPLTRAFTRTNSDVVRELRQRRRAERLQAVRDAVAAIGAPAETTDDATAVLLAMAGAEHAWTIHEQGLPVDRVPDAIARTVHAIVEDLRSQASEPGTAREVALATSSPLRSP